MSKSSSALVYFDFHNYLASTTLMNFTYNSALVTINMIADSAYSVSSDIIGLKRLTNWNPSSTVFRTVKMNVVNPSFAVSYTL